jgi:hypothetical protein
MLSREISGRDEVMSRLNSQINELTQLLALEKGSKQDLDDSVANLQASLATAEGERSRLQSLLSARGRRAGCGAARIGSLTKELDDQKQMSDRAMSQVELLNQQIAALRNQIAAIEWRCRRPSTRTRFTDEDRRSRPPPQRGAGAARAGAEPLPLRLLRPPARNPLRPREHPHRRRPLRLPVGSAVPLGCRSQSGWARSR